MIDELEQDASSHEVEAVDQEVSNEQPAPQPTPQETPQQRNFKALKQAKEQAERERDELIQRLKQQEYMQQQQTTPSEPTLSPDDLVEARYVDQKLKKIEDQLIEVRLKAQYPDFDQVVNKDNLDLLRITRPELHYMLTNSPDLYNKAVSAYTLIKELNITSHDQYEEDRKLAHKNASKPKPLASIAPQQGDTPLSRVNGFVNDYKPTKEYLSQLYKEMTELKKKV